MRQREQEVDREIASFRSSLPSENDSSATLPPRRSEVTTSGFSSLDPATGDSATGDPIANDPTVDNPVANDSATDEAEYGTLEPRPGSELDPNNNPDEPPRS